MNPRDQLLQLLKQGHRLPLRVLGAKVYLHWSAIAMMLALLVIWFRHPANAVVVIACYLGMILLHEAGHAWVARRLGYEATEIHLGVIHGLCEHDGPDSLRESALIAWGGPAAQLVVALPLIALAQFTPVLAWPFANVVVAIFGYIGLVSALFNLAPTAPLDGATAWKLVPILFADWRGRARAKKAADDLFKRLK